MGRVRCMCKPGRARAKLSHSSFDLEMPWVLSGCRNSSNLTYMKTYILQTPITERAEQATEANGQKSKIAKQIFLGIDAHEKSYQVGRKMDAGGIQPVQSFKADKLLGL